MKKVFFAALLLLLFSAFRTEKKTRILFFGDSITELGVKPEKYRGYILQLEDLLKKENKADQYELIGSGISGNKVYDLYLRIEEDVLAKNPDVVVIYVGVNDVWHKTLLGTGTDPDKFEKFYMAIIKRLQAKNIKVVVCTPAVVGEKTDMSNQLDGDLNRYSNIIRDIAKKNNLPLVDLRRQFQEYLSKNNPENKEKEILTYDRLHMNDKGNLFLAQQLWSVLKELK